MKRLLSVLLTALLLVSVCTGCNSEASQMKKMTRWIDGTKWHAVSATDANGGVIDEEEIESRMNGEILDYAWPGNERELKSFVEQMVLVSPGEVMDDPGLIRSTARLTASLLPEWKRSAEAAGGGERPLRDQVNEYELMIIRRCIGKYGSLRKAARALQVDPSVLSRKLAAAKE